MYKEAMTQSTPHVPISWGELIDKITILEIKVDRLADAAARANAAKELALLQDVAGPALARTTDLAGELRAVNGALWQAEDALRDHEREHRFDDAFIQLARAVYRHNDDRAAIKRRINQALGSALVEEKSYKPY